MKYLDTFEVESAFFGLKLDFQGTMVVLKEA